MSDRDRDELAEMIRRVDWQHGRAEHTLEQRRSRLAEAIAEALIAAGWRKTVTPHTPEITPGTEGTWLVYCTACSEAEGDYVQVCRRPIRDGGVFGWPPVVLVPRSSRTVTPEQIKTAHLPAMWWSPVHGLVTESDGVWWYQASARVSLRHDGLPNERPADAIRLGLVPEDGEQ